ncbi:MAG: hypothetical protein COB15_10990 [Flavobacteriales bacterium]|nr:MAG: hypothetical protein COB15_10990 [Flavobacteriales bacterium]
MTRFKELKRIQSAIKHKDEKEIHWALKYCKSRLQFEKLKTGSKYWTKLIDELNDTLENDK